MPKVSPSSPSVTSSTCAPQPSKESQGSQPLTTPASDSSPPLPIWEWRNKTPPWLDSNLKNYFKRVQRAFGSVDERLPSPLMYNTAALVSTSVMFFSNNLVWCSEITFMSKIDLNHVGLQGIWKLCPLLSGDSHFARTKLKAKIDLAVVVGNGTSASLGFVAQFKRVGRTCEDVPQRMRKMLIDAAWSLSASHWLCHTRLGMAVLNTSFSRLLIMDDLLVIEESPGLDASFQNTPCGESGPSTQPVAVLSSTTALAHNYFPGSPDRDAFALYWNTFAQGFLFGVAQASVPQSSAFSPSEAHRPNKHGRYPETIRRWSHPVADPSTFHASPAQSKSWNVDEVPSASYRSGASENMDIDKTADISGSISDGAHSDDDMGSSQCSSNSSSFYSSSFQSGGSLSDLSGEETVESAETAARRMAAEAALLDSLARVFPRIQVVSSADMTRLIAREVEALGVAEPQ